MAIGVIIHSSNLLIIHVQIEGVIACHYCKEIWKIQTSVNGWRGPICQSLGMSTSCVNVKVEIVRTILTHAEIVELAVETIGVEDNPPFIPFDNRHAHLKDEVEKVAGIGDTGIGKVLIGYIRVVGPALEDAR